MRDSLYITCSHSFTEVSITQPAVLATTPHIFNQVSCNGGNNGKGFITAAGGTSPYQYEWSNTATTDTISNLTAGTYYVTVTDFNLCTKVDSITITQPDALTITIDSTRNVSCNGTSTGAIYISVSGGTTDYTYFWSNEATTQDIVNISYRAEGYSVLVTDHNSCTATATATFTQPTLLTSTPTVSNNVSCNGGKNGKGYITANGGTPDYTYHWSNGANTDTISGLMAGKYYVTITDHNLCSKIDSISITQPSVLTASISTTTTTICSGTTILLDLSVTGGTGTISYLWNGGATSQDTTVSAGNYTVTVTDGNLCTTSTATSITNFAIPTITTDETPQVCLSTLDTVTASSTHTGTWTAQAYHATTDLPFGSLVSSNVYTFSSATPDTIYIVYTFVSTTGGCTYTDTTNDIKISGEPRLRIYKNSTEDNYTTINENQYVEFYFKVDNACGTPTGTRLALTYSVYYQADSTQTPTLVSNLTDYVSNSGSLRYKMDLVGTGLSGLFNYTSDLSQAPAAHFPLATPSGAVHGEAQFDFFSLAYFQSHVGTVSISNFTEAGIYTIEYALITNYSDPSMTIPHGNEVGVWTSLDPPLLGGNLFFAPPYYTKVWSTNTMTITVTGVPASPIPPQPTSEKPMKPVASMKVYPNPASPSQTINMEVENILGDALITVTSVSGSVVDKTQVSIVENQKQLVYNLKDITPGIYFITLTSKDAVLTKKIIIQPR